MTVWQLFEIEMLKQIYTQYFTTKQVQHHQYQVQIYNPRNTINEWKYGYQNMDSINMKKMDYSC